MTNKGKGLITFILAVLLIVLSACQGSNTVSNNSQGNNSDSSANGDINKFVEKKDEALNSTPKEFEGPTEAVKPPKDIKIAFIPSDSRLHGVVAPADAAKEAAKKLGWTTQTYDGGGTPDQQNKAILNAVSWGADVIVNISIDPNLVQQGIKAAKESGVLIVSGSNGIDSPNPQLKLGDGKDSYTFDVGPDYAALGETIADWIIADSNGKANIVVFSDKEFPSVLALEAGLMEELKKCPNCTIQPLEYFTGSQVATNLGQKTVGYLKSNPDVNYLFSPFDPAAAAQVTAIRQAGLADRVKLISVLGNQQNLDFIRNNQIQVADGAYDNVYMGYAIIDQVIRSLNDLSLFEPHGENLPYVVLDSTNLPEPGNDWTAPFDYKSEFLGLWGIK